MLQVPRQDGMGNWVRNYIEMIGPSSARAEPAVRLCKQLETVPNERAVLAVLPVWGLFRKCLPVLVAIEFIPNFRGVNDPRQPVSFIRSGRAQMSVDHFAQFFEFVRR